MKKYIQENIIIIVLIIGIILRFKGITFQSYWIDELFRVHTSIISKNFWETYYIIIINMPPLLYLFLLWVWYHIIGFTEFSGIVCSLGIFSIYFLKKELYKEVKLILYNSLVPNKNKIFTKDN